MLFGPFEYGYWRKDHQCSCVLDVQFAGLVSNCGLAGGNIFLALTAQQVEVDGGN